MQPASNSQGVDNFEVLNRLLCIYSPLESIAANVKNLIALSFLIFFIACEQRDENKIIGSWWQCQRDGTYKEFKISSNYTTTIESDFFEHDYGGGISFYRCFIQDSLMIIIDGINVSWVFPDTIVFERLSNDHMILKSNLGQSEIFRLDQPILEIDSTNVELWKEQYRRDFLSRAKLANCSDLRTDKEKIILDLGEVEDDFEDIPEFSELDSLDN